MNSQKHAQALVPTKPSVGLRGEFDTVRTTTTSLEIISRYPVHSLHSTPLLFVHGAWHGAWCWEEHFLGYFAQHGFAAHALSLRGHGHSAGNGSKRFTRIADYVADVEEVVGQLPNPPVLIGHSMGSFITQKYLEKHNAPAGVLLASPPPEGVLHAALRTALHDIRSFLQVNLQMDLYPAVDTLAKMRRALFSQDMPDYVLKGYFRKMEHDSYMAYLDMLLFALPNPECIKTPLLVLGAANDQNFSTAEIERTARAYHASYGIFPNMAHDMMLESGWESVAARIVSWLTELKV
jgi:pimeloyl-ACP methyl ester carboxylesterase